MAVFSVQSTQHDVCLAILALAFMISVPVVAQDENDILFSVKEPEEQSIKESLALSTLALNHHTFTGNVLQVGEHAPTTHFIVSFCVPWWEPCKTFGRPFQQLGSEWERGLNRELLTNAVRFATVDCAVSKVLCNEQGVQSYPEVIHYTGGEQVAKFVGGQRRDSERLQKWLKEQLASVTNISNKVENSGVEASTAEGETSIQKTVVNFLAPGSHGTDLLLACVALVASFRLVLSNSEVWDKSKTIPCISSKHGVDEQVGGMNQAIPEEWGRSRTALEL